jgi:phosphoglycolate phosphatase-like HAD superfamily hydrolase
MKNANIFIDVDLTLVDSNGKLFAGAKEALSSLKAAGCHLFLWSSVGADYCRKVAALYLLTDLFEGFAAKPDIVIDDMPSTCVAPIICSVQKEESWPALARHIVDRHLG